MGLFSLFTREIAIDLGTANTVILHENKVVVDEPSIIAIDSRTKSVVAVGKKALMMDGKTSGEIYTVRPLRNGVLHSLRRIYHTDCTLRGHHHHRQRFVGILSRQLKTDSILAMQKIIFLDRRNGNIYIVVTRGINVDGH